jgi:phage terminase large subunit-like protein
LFPWQVFALNGAFQYDQDNKFVHSKALISAARQNGKTSMNAAIVGWALSDLPRIWGRPVRIMSSAHELSLAAEVFEELRDVFELWEESGLCKVTWAYGRQRVQMVDGSIYAVRAATSKKHGGTWDILLLDEIWAMSEGSIFGALLPSQIAVPSPMCWMTSTAGDESSRAFIKLREQGLASIDTGEPTDLFMAEWSMPGNLNPDDPANFGWANPSLGRTITVKGLLSAAAAPDRSQFLRAHCNLWVAAASSWLPPGLWANCVTDNLEADGGASVLSVDSAVDDSKYLGVWCRLNSDKNIVATIKFSTESLVAMWDKIGEAMDADPKLKLAITPSLYLHTPEKYKLRTVQWGYAELLKYTSLVLSLVREGRVKHDGSEMLAEHCNRAVLVAAQGAKVISTQRSPGPIEAARCMITAAAMVSRPGGAAKPSMGSSK